MFEILDIILGLAFVYLLLSLLCTAINEYIAATINKRGRELFGAIDEMLPKDVLEAFYKHPLIASIYRDRDKMKAYEDEVKAQPKPVRWLYRFVRSIVNGEIRHLRRPSYLPARNFALALLSVTGNLEAPPAPRPDPNPVPNPNPAPNPAPAPVQGDAARDQQGETEAGMTLADLQHLFATLRKDAPAELSALLGDPNVVNLLRSTEVSAEVRKRLEGAVVGVESEIQKLENGVEVWFNNVMDRVSGTYKRYTQVSLFLIGLGVAVALNADTVQLWRRLATDDELREGLAQRAVAMVDSMNASRLRFAAAAAADTTRANRAPADTSATDSARTGATGADTTDVDSVEADSTATTDTTTTATTDSAKAGDGRAGETGGVGGTGGSGRTGGKVESDTLPKPASVTLAAALRRDSATAAQADTLRRAVLAQLDSTDLELGWTREEAVRLGFLQKRVPARYRNTLTAAMKANPPNALAPRSAGEAADSGKAGQGAGKQEEVWEKEFRPWFWHWGPLLMKLVGLILTALALSLGAPFWFDTLNRIINIRGAGRAPHERPVSPEAPGKHPPLDSAPK